MHRLRPLVEPRCPVLQQQHSALACMHSACVRLHLQDDFGALGCVSVDRAVHNIVGGSRECQLFPGRVFFTRILIHSGHFFLSVVHQFALAPNRFKVCG